LQLTGSQFYDIESPMELLPHFEARLELYGGHLQKAVAVSKTRSKRSHKAQTRSDMARLAVAQS
jgi:ATP-dependent protease HslVU (ClpYQ) peptidase subunit